MAASKPTSWLSVQFYILFHLIYILGPQLVIWAVSLSTMELISHCLTPDHQFFGIRSLIGFGKLCGPLAHSVLYPHDTFPEASPKAISRRTSYLRVRLEFHRYPHVIPQLLNANGFGPPPDFTLASTCTWIGHPVSGLQHATFALFRLDFSSAPNLLVINLAAYCNSLARSTKSTRSLFRASTAYRHGVSGSFSLPSRGSFHLSLTVLFSIGHQVVFSLTLWSGQIPTRFLVSRGTLDHILALNCFAYRSFTFFGTTFQMSSPTVYQSL